MSNQCRKTPTQWITLTNKTVCDFRCALRQGRHPGLPVKAGPELQPLCCCCFSSVFLCPKEPLSLIPSWPCCYHENPMEHSRWKLILGTHCAQGCDPHVMAIRVMHLKWIPLTRWEFTNRNHQQKKRFQKQTACYPNQHHLHPPLSTCNTDALPFTTGL